jgi:hypothetical protein
VSARHLHALAAWWQALAADVRALQLSALHDSLQANLSGPAMHYADPLTEGLFAQLEGPAEEGAQPPSTAGAGLTPDQQAALAEADNDCWLLWLGPIGFLAGAVISWLCRLGATA